MPPSVAIGGLDGLDGLDGHDLFSTLTEPAGEKAPEWQLIQTITPDTASAMSLPCGDTRLPPTNTIDPKEIHIQPYDDYDYSYSQNEDPEGCKVDTTMNDPVLVAEKGSAPYREMGIKCLNKAPPGHINNSQLSYPSIPESNMRDATQQPPAMPDANSRFNVTLRAPTAMLNHPDETPITYLNKGQVYSIQVLDSAPPPPSLLQRARYRTHIYISFIYEDQRLKSRTCWDRWKETRGPRDGLQNAQKPRAIEYISAQNEGLESHSRKIDSNIQLENSSGDGFCITWTAAHPITRAAGCSICVRLNFLSTDFSRSKGTKGTPVRLCAKTEIASVSVSGETRLEMTHGRPPEMCCCFVQAFRDHGAERKLATDGDRVRKKIDKLQQGMQQTEIEDSYNRKCASRGSGKYSGSRSTRLHHGYSTYDNLSMLKEKLHSARPVTVFALNRDTISDMDLYSTSLMARDDSPINKNVNEHPNLTAMKEKWAKKSNILLRSSDALNDNPPSMRPTKKRRLQPRTNNTSAAYNTALDITPNYNLREMPHPRPIACFYAQFRYYGSREADPDHYYYAVYLAERTARELVWKLCRKKESIKGRNIRRALLVEHDDTESIVDNEVVRGLRNGQRMVVEISDLSAHGYEEANALNITRNGFLPAIEMRLRCC